MLILGSASPRRKEILNFFSIPFEVIVSPFDESTMSCEQDPIAYVSAIAKEKIKALIKLYPERKIVCADTIVWFENRCYEKPQNFKEAKKFLTQLCGNWHSVFTCVCVYHPTQIFQEVQKTHVLLHHFSDQEIVKYLKQLSYKDKAAGYAIQKAGSVIVDKIDGCYYNAMGLPVTTLRNLLKKIGLNLMDYM